MIGAASEHGGSPRLRKAAITMRNGLDQSRVHRAVAPRVAAGLVSPGLMKTTAAHHLRRAPLGDWLPIRATVA